MKFSARETLESFGLQEMSYVEARNMANEAYASWRLNPSSEAMKALFSASIPLIVQFVFGTRAAFSALCGSILDPEGLIAELYLPIATLVESHDESMSLWSTRLSSMAPRLAIDVTRRREYRRNGDATRGRPPIARVFSERASDSETRSLFDFVADDSSGDLARIDDRDELQYALAESSPRSIYATVRFAEGTKMRDIGAELDLSESRVCQIISQTTRIAAERLGVQRGNKRGSGFGRKNRQKFKMADASSR